MEDILKFILSIILLIAGIFLAQSAFTMDVQVQEALNPPDTFLVVSAISAPAGQSEFTQDAIPVVTPLVHNLSHLNSYIINTSDKISVGKTLLPVANFQEVETVPKFPWLIRNSVEENTNGILV